MLRTCVAELLPEPAGASACAWAPSNQDDPASPANRATMRRGEGWPGCALHETALDDNNNNNNKNKNKNKNKDNKVCTPFAALEGCTSFETHPNLKCEAPEASTTI